MDPTDNHPLSNDWTSTPIVNRSNDTTVKAAESNKDFNDIRSLLLQQGMSQTSTPKQCSFKITKLVLKDIPKPKIAKPLAYTISPYTSPGKQTPDLSKSLPLDVITNTTAKTTTEFQEKKMERTKCIEDFREYLEESFTRQLRKPLPEQLLKTESLLNSPVKALPIAPSRKPSAFVSRSKENLLNVAPKPPRGPDKSKPLRASNEKLPVKRTAAVPEKITKPPAKKEKSYDPKIAQEFMKQQQEKRKLTAQPLIPIQRNVIKQRLADLRKNTLRIVSNNVKNQKNVPSNRATKVLAKKPTTVVHPRPKSLPVSRKNSSVKKPIAEKSVTVSRQPSTTSLKAENESLMKRQGSTHSLKGDGNDLMMVTDDDIHKMDQLLSDLELKKGEKMAAKSDEQKTSKPTSRESTRKSGSQLMTPDFTQKMGILRKPDSLTLETPISPLKLSRKVSAASKDVSNLPVKETLNETIPFRDFSFNNDQDLDLKIPDVKLQSPALSHHSRSTNQDQPTISRKQRPNVPYWLQQTAIQPYPYNFITAVRKKLQAIVSVDNKTGNKEVQTSTFGTVPTRRSKAPALNLVSSTHMYQETPKATKAQNAQKRKLELQDWPSQHDGGKTSKSLSEMNTNMSSISLPMSEVNTISEISSIKSDGQHNIIGHGDKRTYSSSFPSSLETSPENKTEHVPIINSPVKSQKKEAGGEEHRRSKTFVLNGTKLLADSPFSVPPELKNSTFVSQRTTIDEPKEKIVAFDTTIVDEDKGQRNSTDLEYQRLLEAFNKSLSQVTHVHQQLYSAFQHQQSQTQIPNDKVPLPPTTQATQCSVVTQTSPVVSVQRQTVSSYDDDFEEQPKVSSGSSTLKETTVETASSTKSQTVVMTTTTSSQSFTQVTTSSIRTATAAASSSNNSIRTQINESLPRSNGEEKSFAVEYSEGTMVEEEQKEDSPSDKENIPVEPVKSQDNATMASDVFAYFTQSDIEVSYLSAGDISNISAKTNISYSSIGVVEKMIQMETSKSDQLGTLIKMREKALIDRTKGQIAWLELQKQRFKAKGMPMEISAIKKKQRAVLVRLQKEREEILKSTKQDTVDAAALATNKFKLDDFDSSSISLRKTFTPRKTASRMSAMKVYEFEANEELEKILQKREEELKKRRAYVQRLLEWHEKLDREENEIFQMERNLLDFNTGRKIIKRPAINLSQVSQSAPENASHAPAIDKQVVRRAKQLKHIEKSLRELQTVTPSNASFNGTHTEDDVVEISGVKLNKLWHRLTESPLPKYDDSQSYQLDKATLERLYEDAKRHVLTGFRANEANAQIKKLLETSVVTKDSPEQLEPLVENIFDNSASSNRRHLVTQMNIAGAAIAEPEMKESNRDDEVGFSSPEKLPADPQSLAELQRSMQSGTFEREESNDEKITLEISQDGEEPMMDLSSMAVVEKSETFNLQVDEIVEEVVTELEKPTTPQIPETGDDISSLDDLKSLEDNTFEDDSIDFPNVTPRHQPLTPNELLIENISFPNFNDTTNVDTSLANDTPQNAYSLQINNDNSTDLTTTMPDNRVDYKECDKVNISFDKDKPTASHSDGENDNDDDDQVHAVVGDSASAQTPPQSGSYDSSEKSIEFEEITEEDKASSGSAGSELEKRLMTLNDSLEELSEIFSQQQQKLTRMSPARSVSPEIVTTSAPLSAMSSFLSDALRTYSHDLDFQEKSRSEAVLTVVKPTSEKSGSDDDEETNSAATLTPETNLSPQLVLKDETAVAVPVPSTSSSISVIVRREELTFVPIIAVASTSKATPPDTMVTKTMALQPQIIHNTRIMPDIINEAEVLRRQQLQIEQEIKQLEQQVVLMREIPNKPPPPYIPPSQGNPLSLIYPSAQRINDLVSDTVKELYENDGVLKQLSNEPSPPPIQGPTGKNGKFSENIVNTYEKIILDLCREFYAILKQPTTTISFMKHKNYKNPLAFYNPPNDLECLQEHILRKIKRILNIPNIDFSSGGAGSSNSSMDNTPSSPSDSFFINNFSVFRPQHYNVNPFFGSSIMKRKRDHVDEILVLEMLEEEVAWTNFDNEEIEVKNEVTNQIMVMLMEEALGDIEAAYNTKHDLNVDDSEKTTTNEECE